MTIAHITYAFGLGGIETMLRNIVNEQTKYGNCVHLIIINNFVNKELHGSLDESICFHNIGRTPGSKNPWYYLRLNLLLKRINADIIHLHYSSIARFIIFPQLKQKLCVTQHDVCNIQNSRFLHKSKRIYAISNIVKNDIKKWTGLNSEVILNGIDINKIRHKKNNDHKSFRIVQTSRLMHKKKGQHILINALALLINRGHNQLSLDLIGEGESHNYLEGLTRKLGITQYINFLGAKNQSYIYEHLCEYDLYVQPSIYEGFGLTVTEAMAAKIPVLVSENQGPLEIIDYGVYGDYFKNKDIEDCANKIEMFIKKENNRSKIEKAYDRVHKLYDVKTTAKNYLKQYENFISSGYARI